MKKLLLTTILSISILFSFSQTNYYCNSLKTANWNDYTKKWIFNEEEKTNLTFTFGKDYVKVNDRAHSFYNIYANGNEVSKDDYNSFSWKATDESGRRVDISIIHYKDTGTNVFTVMYENKLFVYYITSSELSPL